MNLFCTCEHIIRLALTKTSLMNSPFANVLLTLLCSFIVAIFSYTNYKIIQTLLTNVCSKGFYHFSFKLEAISWTFCTKMPFYFVFFKRRIYFPDVENNATWWGLSLRGFIFNFCNIVWFSLNSPFSFTIVLFVFMATFKILFKTYQWCNWKTRMTTAETHHTN